MGAEWVNESSLLARRIRHIYIYIYIFFIFLCGWFLEMLEGSEVEWTGLEWTGLDLLFEFLELFSIKEFIPSHVY